MASHTIPLQDGKYLGALEFLMLLDRVHCDHLEVRNMKFDHETAATVILFHVLDHLTVLDG